MIGYFSITQWQELEYSDSSGQSLRYFFVQKEILRPREQILTGLVSLIGMELNIGKN
jgi:hypothetical protein